MFQRKDLFGRLVLAVAVSATLFLTTSPASADITYQTGNQQYTNVNIAADVVVTEVFGEVGNTGINVAFQGFNVSSPLKPPHVTNPPDSSLLFLHGQHGVAFIEPVTQNFPTDPTHPDMFQMTISAPLGWGFDAFDLALDAKNTATADGTVFFDAFDPFGNHISAPGGNSFPFDLNGQNPYNGFTTGGSIISELVVTSTIPIIDMKQVSLDLVQAPAIPEPSTLILAGSATAALAGFGWRRNRRQAAV